MGAYAAIMLGLVVLVAVAIVLVGIFYPGTGAEQLGWTSQRDHAEREAAREAEDLTQMLEAANRRRRARGEPELTVRGLIDEERRARRR